MSKHKDNPHRHYIWGENRINHPEDEFIIKMSFPRLYIRYRLADALFADFDEFYASIADVQWMDGQDSIPTRKEQQRIFTEAWNYLCIARRPSGSQKPLFPRKTRSVKHLGQCLAPRGIFNLFFHYCLSVGYLLYIT